MLSLVLKDFYSWKANFFVLFIVSIFFAIFSILGNGYMTSSFLTLFVPLQCVSMTGVDIGKKGSLAYLLTTPISRRKYVASRYLMVFLMTLVPIFIVGLNFLIVYLQGRALETILIYTLLNFFIGVFCISFAMPLVLKYGNKRFAIILLVTFMPLVIVGFSFFPDNPDTIYQLVDSLKNIPMLLWLAVIVLVFALMIGISFYASVKIMQKKEF